MPNPPAKKSDELFEKSTMTFGQHLEELRKALGKAFIWLAIGMSVSLLFAKNIIDYIQLPLVNSLENFYYKKAEDAWVAANGVKMDPSLRDFMVKFKYTPETIYWNREEVAAAIASQDHVPELTSASETPASTDSAKGETPKSIEGPSDLAKLPKNFSAAKLEPLRLWRKITTNTDALQVTEPFMIYIKAGLVAGLVLASPGIFWHIWGFISAGLYPHERRYVYFFLPASLGLFIGGAALAFFGVFRIVLEFLLTFNASLGIDAAPRLNDYMTFALLLPLGFGVAFQLPLVMLILERIGICSVATYLAQWRWALLIIAFISMVLTPGDITPMIAMMIPLIGLYFLGIAMCKYLPRGSALGTGGYDVS